ncbi:hypothetical protein BSKO_11241 [Bryopsis sp. KO-2023]|nr:hypothetical protein BSKO_11241 [Bryopsis sp. KO-2023]
MGPESRHELQEATFGRPVESGVVLFGLSPKNGYYRKNNIAVALQYILATLSGGWTVRPFVPEGPSVWTYLAVGYTKEAGVRSARGQSTELRRNARFGANGDPRYKDCKWDDLTGGETNASFAKAIKRFDVLHETNDVFRRDVDEATRGVLEKVGKGTKEAIAVGRRYVIEELAALTVVREMLGTRELVLVYHRPFLLAERLFEGTLYGLPKMENASVAIVNAEHLTSS